MWTEEAEESQSPAQSPLQSPGPLQSPRAEHRANQPGLGLLVTSLLLSNIGLKF